MSTMTTETETAVDLPEMDCVSERIRSDWRLNVPDQIVWHVAPHRGRDVDFMPIRCHPEEGIVASGGIHRRQPTCPDCVRIVTTTEATDA